MKHISDAIGQFIKKTGLGERQEEDRIFEEWKIIAGPEDAAMAEPFKFEGGKLYLQAENSVMVSELTYKKKALKARINKALGRALVKDIVVRIRQ
jgi:predicted nucleic acid-binding Zn ribbon protein